MPTVFTANRVVIVTEYEKYLNEKLTKASLRQLETITCKNIHKWNIMIMKKK